MLDVDRKEDTFLQGWEVDTTQKGDKLNYKNCRGISLVSVAARIYENVLESRLMLDVSNTQRKFIRKFDSPNLHLPKRRQRRTLNPRWNKTF